MFDTNVLVSALLLPNSKPRQALDRALQKGKVLLSFAVLGELYEVLSRKQFRRYIDEEDIRTFVAVFDSGSRMGRNRRANHSLP